MTLAEFSRALATFGADLERWPADRRPGAAALLDRLPEARAAWAAARPLDNLLDRDRARTAPEDAARRQGVINLALARVREDGRTAPPAGRKAHSPFGFLTRPIGLAFVCAAVAGVVAGFAGRPVFEPPARQDQGGVPAVSLLLGDGGPLSKELF